MVGHALKNLTGTLGAGVATRFRALVRRHSIAVPQTFHLATSTFYGSSGRSRIDFVATPHSVQFSRIFVNFTAGRRQKLIPAAEPCDHMPLTMDLVTNGMRHCPDPTRGRSRENRRNALGSRCKAHFLQGTRDKNSQFVDPGTCSDRGHS